MICKMVYENILDTTVVFLFIICCTDNYYSVGFSIEAEMANSTLEMSPFPYNTVRNISVDQLIDFKTYNNDDHAVDHALALASSADALINIENLQKHINENYEEINLLPRIRQEFGKQIGLPDDPIGLLVSRSPCTCKSGLCACCTGMLVSAFRSKGCMNLKYIPEEFAFEFKMKFNDAVLYKNKISGRNPPPVCVRPPRLPFIEVCATFYDLFFAGRNMHVCLEMGGYFQGFQLFNRSFDCMRIGDKGVKFVKPEEGGGLSQKPTNSADIDDDDDDEDIEDYDENLVRSNLNKN